MNYKTLIEERLRREHYKTQLEEENALKQIFQEIILYSLSKIGFFNVAAFHGGTELRIVKGLNRFSEDLDFTLFSKEKKVEFASIVDRVKNTLKDWQIEMEVIDKSKAKSAIKKMLLKESSLAKLLILNPSYDKRKNINIKIELDINPPEGINTEINYLEYPMTFPVVCFDLSTGFSGKLHALLCRGFDKGRDWYDLIWYLQRKPEINKEFIKNAFNQLGPWAGKNINVDKSWIVLELQRKIKKVNFKDLKKDISPFIKSEHLDSIEFWVQSYFEQAVQKWIEI